MSLGLRIVIIGGGIAGTSCLESLIDERSDIKSTLESITLISESRLVKRIANYTKQGRNLENFDISTIDASELHRATTGTDLKINVVVGRVARIDDENQVIHFNPKITRGTSTPTVTSSISYDILCLCHGSRPRELLAPGHIDDEVRKRILTIRDTTTVDELGRRLSKSRKVAVIGNGGISLEIVNKLTGCDVEWIVRDEYIGHPFLDSEASRFLLDVLQTRPDLGPSQLIDRESYVAQREDDTMIAGPALGPHWIQDTSLSGCCQKDKTVRIVFRSEVKDVSLDLTSQFALKVDLKDGNSIECDLLIVAIGVVPNKLEFTSGGPDLNPEDGGILIDEEMRTSIKNIYAAGDVVSCEKWTDDGLWFQMRLWTQARQMGHYCGKCVSAHLASEEPTIFANFDCFTHVTSFFGHRLVLLGRYNAQKLPTGENNDVEALARVNSKNNYIKLVIRNNRVLGAILIGETNLDETVENLIHDQIDIGDIKHSLLDDTVDIEDYFD